MNFEHTEPLEHALDRNAAFLVKHQLDRLFKTLNKSGKIQFFHEYSSKQTVLSSWRRAFTGAESSFENPHICLYA